MNKIIVGVGAVVITQNKILLVKRRNPPCKGYWSIPGGRVEYGESLVAAVKRELLEETNIKAEPLGVIWVDEVLPGSCSDNMEHFILIDFLMKPQEIEELRAGSDALEADFYRIDRLPSPLTSSAKRLLNYLNNLIKEDVLYYKIISL